MNEMKKASTRKGTIRPEIFAMVRVSIDGVTAYGMVVSSLVLVALHHSSLHDDRCAQDKKAAAQAPSTFCRSAAQFLSGNESTTSLPSRKRCLACFAPRLSGRLGGLGLPPYMGNSPIINFAVGRKAHFSDRRSRGTSSSSTSCIRSIVAVTSALVSFDGWHA